MLLKNLDLKFAFDLCKIPLYLAKFELNHLNRNELF